MSSDLRLAVERAKEALKGSLEEVARAKSLLPPKGSPVAPRLDVALFFVRRAMAVLEGLSVIDEGGALRQFEGEVLDIEVERDVLEFNRRVALENRRILDERGVRAVDFMGSLGAGKTSLIEALIRRLKEKYRVAVIVGDVASSVDADRISRLGVKAIQVNTGRECHLDAQLVRRALEALNLGEVDLLFIENVGNLICPADFPLGAHSRVVVISVSEGGDMVLKHPLSFRDVDLVVVNKVDVADSFGVKPQDLAEDVRRVNPKANVVLSSVKTGLGIDDVVKALNL